MQINTNLAKGIQVAVKWYCWLGFIILSCSGPCYGTSSLQLTQTSMLESASTDAQSPSFTLSFFLSYRRKQFFLSFIFPLMRCITITTPSHHRPLNVFQKIQKQGLTTGTKSRFSLLVLNSTPSPRIKKNELVALCLFLRNDKTSHNTILKRIPTPNGPDFRTLGPVEFSSIADSGKIKVLRCSKLLWWFLGNAALWLWSVKGSSFRKCVLPRQQQCQRDRLP